MEGPILPEGSGGEEPPEEPQEDEEALLRAEGVYQARMWRFEQVLDKSRTKPKKVRRRLSDYTERNCEEAGAERWRSS